MTARVPAGWSTAKIGDVTFKPLKCEPVSTGRDRIRYVDIGQLDGPTSDLSDAPEIDSKLAPSRCRQVVEGGDTLYSTVRPYLRKIAFVQAALDGEFASTGYCVLRPAREIHPRYLYYFMLSKQFEDQLLPLQKGVSYPAVLDREVRAQRVWYPDMPEQRRIVEILEDHLSHLDAGQNSLKVATTRQRAWKTGVLQHWVWDDSFASTTVADILREPMRNGRSDRASTDPDAVRTLTLTAVTKGQFSEQNTKLTSTSKDVAAGLWLEPGDIFVQRSNTPELVGTSARYDGPREWAIFPDLLIRIRPDESRMDSRFLAAALRSERAHRALRQQAKGLAGSMPKIDQRAIAETVVALPPLERQLEIVARLQEVDDADGRLLTAVESAAARGQALRRAVLAAAFEGRLTGRQSDTEVIEEMAHEA